MPTNKTFRLHPKAERDLEEIYIYTHHLHGMHQADSYIRQIETAMQNLASQPGMARSRDEIRPDLKAFSVGLHVVFFKPTANGITVVRVLHQSMDYVRHL